MNKRPYHYPKATKYNRRISWTPRIVSRYSLGLFIRHIDYVLRQRFKQKDT